MFYYISNGAGMLWEQRELFIQLISKLRVEESSNLLNGGGR